MQLLCSMAARLLPWAVMLTAGAVAYSCADDDIIEGGISSEIIEFNASISDNASSRSSIDSISERKCLSVRRIEGYDSLYIHTIMSDLSTTPDIQSRASQKTDMSEYGSFGVTAYAFDGNWEESIAGAEKHLDNVKVEQKDDGLWDAGAACRWPVGKKSVKFAAYAPYNAESGATPQITDNGISLSYSTNAGASKQMDLVVASAEYSKPAESVNLSFKHALTAVKFETGDDFIPGTISRITFKNVLAGGVYSYDTKTWTPSGDVSDFTLAMKKELDGTPNQSVNDGENIFMFMPQTLPENAELEVMYKDKITETTRTFTVTLNGTIWPMGKEVVYRLSTTSISIIPHFKVTLNKDSLSHSGETAILKVISYAEYAAAGDNIVNKSIPWMAEFLDDDGNWSSQVPSWLTNFPLSGSGSYNSTSFSVTASAQEYVNYDNHTNKLRNATPRGTAETPFDLSMHDIYGNPNTSGMTTANCYVVSAPGVYMLPLIYGNAVKDGKINEQSYISSGDLKTFVAWPSVTISSPVLNDHSSITPSRAELLWNDVSRNFIKVTSSLKRITTTIGSMSKNLHYLVFEIPASEIRQGNALIAVKNSDDKILWSWHIWVTDQCNKTQSIHTRDRYEYILPVNLGWAGEIKRVYHRRTAKVRFKMRGNNEYTYIDVIQSRFTEYHGHCMSYQWGRKDPFPLGNGETNSACILYDSSGGNPKIATSTAKGALGPTIQKPTTYICNTSTQTPTTGNQRNLWSSTCKSGEYNITPDDIDPTVVKTVYDPCPPGFTVPQANTFCAFTIDGQSASSESEWKPISKDVGWGVEFIINRQKIFFPYAGRREAPNGKLSLAGERAYSWTAYPRTITGATNGARLFTITSSTVNPCGCHDRAWALPVRPAEER